MTSGPVPCSATCIRMPLVSTVRCVSSFMARLPLECDSSAFPHARVAGFKRLQTVVKVCPFAWDVAGQSHRQIHNLPIPQACTVEGVGGAALVRARVAGYEEAAAHRG